MRGALSGAPWVASRRAGVRVPPLHLSMCMVLLAALHPALHPAALAGAQQQQQQQPRTVIESRWCPAQEGRGETPVTCERPERCPDSRVLWTGGDRDGQPRRVSVCGDGLVCCLPPPARAHMKRFIPADRGVAYLGSNDLRNGSEAANPLSLSEPQGRARGWGRAAPRHPVYFLEPRHQLHGLRGQFERRQLERQRIESLWRPAAFGQEPQHPQPAPPQRPRQYAAPPRWTQLAVQPPRTWLPDGASWHDVQVQDSPSYGQQTAGAFQQRPGWRRATGFADQQQALAYEHRVHPVPSELPAAQRNYPGTADFRSGQQNYGYPTVARDGYHQDQQRERFHPQQEDFYAQRARPQPQEDQSHLQQDQTLTNNGHSQNPHVDYYPQQGTSQPLQGYPSRQRVQVDPEPARPHPPQSYPYPQQVQSYPNSQPSHHYPSQDVHFNPQREGYQRPQEAPSNPQRGSTQPSEDNQYHQQFPPQQSHSQPTPGRPRHQVAQHQGHSSIPTILHGQSPSAEAHQDVHSSEAAQHTVQQDDVQRGAPREQWLQPTPSTTPSSTPPFTHYLETQARPGQRTGLEHDNEQQQPHGEAQPMPHPMPQPIPQPSGSTSDSPLNWQPAKPGVKSRRMCERYSRATQLQANSLLLNGDVGDDLVQARLGDCSSPISLVVGGQNASQNEFPHMAAVGFRGGGSSGEPDQLHWLCGGSLISDQFVLTAAHCTHTGWGSPAVVRVGTSFLADAPPSTHAPLDVAVKEVVPHPLYAPPARYHDVALLRLDGVLPLSDRVRPACLPPPHPAEHPDDNLPPESLVVATGWGRLSYAGDTSDVLQKVALRVWPRPSCARVFQPDGVQRDGARRGQRLQDGLGPGMLCAGAAHSSRDTCQGDSGGPLQRVTPDNPCAFEVVGITSFGRECGLGLPAVYTRVSYYVAWIESVVWSE